jgi:predicted lipoprotein with Yx(FWY)xxD motif
MNRWPYAVALLLVFTALTTGGCGDGDEAATGSDAAQSSTTATTTSKPKKKEPRLTVVNTSGVPGVGSTLLDSRWFVLYEFSRDKGKTSTCYGACAKQWPPLITVGRKTLFVGAGASERSLGTTKRKGGAIQVTYAGHPVYRYTGDVRRWHSRGDGVRAFGGVFHGLIDPNFE